MRSEFLIIVQHRKTSVGTKYSTHGVIYGVINFCAWAAMCLEQVLARNRKMLTENPEKKEKWRGTIFCIDFRQEECLGVDCMATRFGRIRVDALTPFSQIWPMRNSHVINCIIVCQFLILYSVNLFCLLCFVLCLPLRWISVRIDYATHTIIDVTWLQ